MLGVDNIKELIVQELRKDADYRARLIKELEKEIKELIFK